MYRAKLAWWYVRVTVIHSNTARWILMMVAVKAVTAAQLAMAAGGEHTVS